VKKSTATGKNANNYYFEFIINADKYIISFDSKESTYIYDVTLEVGKKAIDIRKRIKQNVVEYYEKVEHFIAALEANGENNKVDVLFKDTLELYSKKKGFSFLIILFLKIYLKKDLCISLLKKFKAMNLNPKDNEKNMDRKSFLKDYESKFREILSESDKIIEQNNYNPIEFYGLLLCYINFYDNETFPTVIEQLYKKAPNELYEILLFYSAHFKYPLKQDIDFFNNFIQYTITNKDFSIFNVAINYIKDIETFLDVMDKNKELIFKKYIEPDISKNVYKCIVKIDNNIKFKKAKIIDYNPIIIDTPSDKEKEKEEKEIEQKETIEESSNVIKTKEKKTESDNEEKITQIDEKYFEEKVKKKIQSIIDFCKNKNIFLIYMTNNFCKIVVPYDGSPFSEDCNKEYRFNKIIEIQEDAKDDKLIILENLNQLHPFLYDLYNMNYQIIDDKRFARICLDNFNEQLTLVNKNFKIIILEDKKYINKCELAFLNRLEKMNLSFDKLLQPKLRSISNNIKNDLKLKPAIDYFKRDINYSLKDLLINCGDEEIQGLIYNTDKENKKNENENDEEETNKNNIDEKTLRDIVINKIYKVLPQDIICILNDDNIIKEKYCELKNIYNFKDYLNQEENKNYKISIIYTFSYLSNTIEGLNKELSFFISGIKSEKDFISVIEEMKNSQKNKENYICIRFEQINSKHVKFICNLILETFKDDSYNYIIIIHLNRNFNKEKKERIYSLPDINPDINQIFIDNLNGSDKIVLNDLLTKNIKEFLEEQKEELELEGEFDKTLTNFLKAELNDKNIIDNENDEYINEMKEYIEEGPKIKNKIIEIAFKLIANSEEDVKCKSIIEKAYRNKLIDKYTIDIASFLVKYIRDHIFNDCLKSIFI